MGDAAAADNGGPAACPCPSNLRILICTGNLGNAAPTKESFAAWLPQNGSVEEVLRNAKYPLAQQEPPTEADMGGRFDIIAIGMQEAVFSTNHMKDASVKAAAKLSAIPEVTEQAAAKLSGMVDEGVVSSKRLSLSDLKMLSMRGLLPNRSSDGVGDGDGDHSLSDDSMMSLIEKEGNDPTTGDDAGGDDAPDAPDARKRAYQHQTSRDGPMLDTGIQSPVTSPKKATNVVAKTVGGVVTAAKEKVVKPVATTIVSVAGNVDHTRGKPPPGAAGQSRTKASIFGLDTILDGAKPAEWVGGTRELYDLGDEQLGLGKYDALVRYQRGEMRLVVLVRKELSPLITNIETLAENTGIAGIVANKGGIISTLTIAGKTRISFLTAHLEAHEGRDHYNNRCSNLAEIATNDKRLADSQGPTFNDHGGDRTASFI